MEQDDFIKERLGTTLRGKWTLKRVLGAGGMAAVYVGVHKIGREDAIKILHPEVSRSATVRARFEQEAHAANRLKHPGVVEIRDIDTAEDGAPFMVMELLDGEPLSARQKRLGSMPHTDVLRFADELLDVLVAAHGQGIIHRDIKPDNLFILGDGRLKVLDFGIARMKEGAAETMHTRAGSTLGTVAYMPPEQTMGSNIDERADLFAVGATMFRLLANRYIHDANSEMDLLVKMASDPAPPLASVAPSLPRAVCLIVDRALAFSKAQRYPDAKTMQADVRAVRAGGAPSYAESRLASEGPPTGPSLRGSSAALNHALGVPEEKPTMQEGKASAVSAFDATQPSLSAGPQSMPMSPAPPVPSSSPSSLASSQAPLPSISQPISARQQQSSSPAIGGSASAIMPVLAGRTSRAKAESEGKRKMMIIAGAAGALVLALVLVIWLIARRGGDTETAEEPADEASTSASSEPSGRPASPSKAPPPPAKGKGKAKWRTPRGSGE